MRSFFIHRENVAPRNRLLADYRCGKPDSEVWGQLAFNGGGKE